MKAPARPGSGATRSAPAVIIVPVIAFAVLTLTFSDAVIRNLRVAILDAVRSATLRTLFASDRRGARRQRRPANGRYDGRAANPLGRSARARRLSPRNFRTRPAGLPAPADRDAVQGHSHDRRSRALAHLPLRHEDQRVFGPRPSISRPPASSATPRSACIPGKSWAWPASRAWVSSICFSPVSAWPI